MKASNVVAVPFEVGAALSHRRFFHPAGVLADGALERLAPPGVGLPMGSGRIVGRLSKGLGTPGALPDFAGLAWRMQPAPFAATPWDVLLVSAGVGSGASAPDRMLLRPVTSWSGAAYSSLMPLRYRDELWWIRARLVRGASEGGLAVAAAAHAIDAVGVEFDIEQGCGTAEFAPLARLTLTEVITSDDAGQHIAFDPVRHTAPGVAVWPEWLREIRGAAYRGSREGRDAG